MPASKAHLMLDGLRQLNAEAKSTITIRWAAVENRPYRQVFKGRRVKVKRMIIGYPLCAIISRDAVDAAVFPRSDQSAYM
jgi:hypothetical protein